MKVLARTHDWLWMFRHQPLTIRLLTAAAALLTAASALAAPASADPNADDAFIDALNHAGIDFGQPGNAMAVGESICPMLSQPGGSFAGAVASIRSRGMSPAMAQTFTTIAIQSYCPAEISNLANGNMSGLTNGVMPGTPGATMPNMPNLPSLPNMPGGAMPYTPGGVMPGTQGTAPGLPQITGPGI
jgi:hypothetical protein